MGILTDSSEGEAQAGYWDGSRDYWYRSTSENAKWRQITRGGPLNWGSDTYQFQTGINKHQAYNTTTNVPQVGSRYVTIFNKWVIMG